MEYRSYEVKVNNQKVPVLALRHFWNEEHEIYREIKNAYVLKMFDHLFLVPLTEKIDNISDKPSTVVDGIYYHKEESCNQCVNRLTEITEGCRQCSFQTKEKKRFDQKNLEKYLEKNKAEKINLLASFTKEKIENVFKYYNLIPFHKQHIVTVEDFKSFLEKLGYQIVLETEEEVVYQEKEIFYEFKKTGPFVEQESNSYTKKELYDLLSHIEEEIEELKIKKEKLKNLIEKR